MGKRLNWIYPQLSNEKNTGWLGYIGDYTAQVYRDFAIKNTWVFFVAGSRPYLEVQDT